MQIDLLPYRNPYFAESEIQKSAYPVRELSCGEVDIALVSTFSVPQILGNHARRGTASNQIRSLD